MSTKSTVTLAAALLLSGGVAALAASAMSHGGKTAGTYSTSRTGPAYSGEFTPGYESALDAYAMEHSVRPFSSADQWQFERQPGVSSER